MRRLLQKGAELSYLEGLIDGDTKQKYYMSGTCCRRVSREQLYRPTCAPVELRSAYAPAFSESSLGGLWKVNALFKITHFFFQPDILELFLLLH